MTTLLVGQPAPEMPVRDDDVDLVRDRALVERAQSGDRSAFDDLYQRYYQRLFRFCLRRLQDSHEAEDIVQESFARAWRALPNFSGERRFYPWLSVIAAHLCTDATRRRNRTTPVAEFHQNNTVSTEECGEERMVAAVDSDLVAQAFQRLTERHRRILSMREGSGWSYQMIADHEGVGITAVETLLWRARQSLKREFTALAGPDGRLAGVVGTAIGLATLRRLLRSTVAVARKAAHGSLWQTTALAVGSTAAVSAIVVAGVLPGLSHQETPPVTVQPTGVSVSHAPRYANTPTTPNVASGATAGARPDASPHASATSRTPLSESVSPAAASPTPSPTNASDVSGATGTVVGSLTGTVAGSLGSIVQSVGSTVTHIVSPGTSSGARTSVVPTVTSVLGSTTGQALPDALSEVSSLTDPVTSTVGQLAAQATGVVNQALGDVAGQLAALPTAESSPGTTTTTATTTAGDTSTTSTDSAGTDSTTGATTGATCTLSSTVDDVTSTLGGLVTGTETAPSDNCPG